MNAITATAPRQNWRMAFVLGGAAALSVLAVIPYMLELLPAEQRAQLPPMAVVVPLQLLQSFVLLTLMAWAGLRLGERNGLDAPLLRVWLGGGRSAPSATWWRDALLGGLLALLAAVLVVALLDPLLPTPRGDTPPAPTPLQGFFASFYGSIAEELQLRLFLMSLLAWLLARAGLARDRAVPLAIIGAAIVFGAGHLPTAAQVWPLDTLVVTRTILANALPGLVFGALFWRRGLECAMAAHFLADIGLHVVAPIVAG